MRVLCILAMLALVNHSGTALADDSRDGLPVAIKARYVFTPVGFDDNDQAQIVIDGYLPSGCYRLIEPQVTVDQIGKTIKVVPMARYFNAPCIEALIPYFQVIRLGSLAVGTYSVNVMDGLLVGQLDIVRSDKPGPDDYPYAPVDSARVKQDPNTGRLIATIEGRFTNTCMGWSELRIIDHGGTINILPIMEMQHGICGPQEVPFAKSIILPESIAQGRHLLHVRSLNGQAVNYLFYKN